MTAPAVGIDLGALFLLFAVDRHMLSCNEHSNVSDSFVCVSVQAHGRLGRRDRAEYISAGTSLARTHSARLRSLSWLHTHGVI